MSDNFALFRFRGWASQRHIPKKVSDLMSSEDSNRFNEVMDRFDSILCDIKKPLIKGNICNECREKYYLENKRKIEITNESSVCNHCSKWNKSDIYYKIGDKK